ncbi:MAG: CRISPR system precrRNA processing endoribonuclease RAMP protein Cas6 [Nitrososphaerota archaeon]
MQTLETEGHKSVMIRLSYKLRVSTPITVTNYSGHITNAIAKRFLSMNDPLPHLISVTPLMNLTMSRYLIDSPILLPIGTYGFTVTCPTSNLQAVIKLAGQSHIEIEGIKCQVEGIELQPIDIHALRSPEYPEYFSLQFLTPTRMGKLAISAKAGKAIYELLPIPTYVFGSLASIWNKIVPAENAIEIDKYVEWIRSHMIIVPPFNLRSQTVRLGGGRRIPGFVGKVTYTSIKPNSYEHAVTVILARLSQFTGVGLGRRLGLGVTRYLDGREEN